jgi:hypothetical protein
VGIVSKLSTAVLMSLGLVLSACGTGTAMISTYRSPQPQQVAFKKVLVVAPMATFAQRRQAEDALALRVRATQVVPSYTIIPEGELHDRASLEAQLTKLGFDGVVVYRVVTPDQDTWVPGVSPCPSYTFAEWPVSDVSDVNMRTFVRTHTDVYAVPGGRLLWSGMATTYNPRTISWLVGDSSNQLARSMRKTAVVALR